MLDRLDKFFTTASRTLAQRTSRRGALGRIGRLMAGAAAAFPVLPVDRTAHAAGRTPAAQDPTSCDYWRYCAFDGFLCSCCGGSASTCPPGTSPSSASWVGTCRNPADGRSYLISYNDCCGKSSCGRCACNTNEGERPGYRMSVHNDINWCMANGDSTMFHCTTALLLGPAQ